MSCYSSNEVRHLCENGIARTTVHAWLAACKPCCQCAADAHISSSILVSTLMLWADLHIMQRIRGSAIACDRDMTRLSAAPMLTHVTRPLTTCTHAGQSDAIHQIKQHLHTILTFLTLGHMHRRMSPPQLRPLKKRKGSMPRQLQGLAAPKTKARGRSAAVRTSLRGRRSAPRRPRRLQARRRSGLS